MHGICAFEVASPACASISELRPAGWSQWALPGHQQHAQHSLPPSPCFACPCSEEQGIKVRVSKDMWQLAKAAFMPTNEQASRKPAARRATAGAALPTTGDRVGCCIAPGLREKHCGKCTDDTGTCTIKLPKSFTLNEVLEVVRIFVTRVQRVHGVRIDTLLLAGNKDGRGTEVSGWVMSGQWCLR